MDHKNRRVTDTGLSCFPTSCYPTPLKLLSTKIPRAVGEQYNSLWTPACWELIETLSGAYQTQLCPTLGIMRGHHLPGFGCCRQQPPARYLFLLHHFCELFWGRRKTGYPYSKHVSLHLSLLCLMHRPIFLAHTSGISPSCTEAKVQSPLPQVEAVPVSADVSTSIVGITDSHFATH